MFADVSGSSTLYKREGNVSAKHMIDQAIKLMRDITLANKGIVVKTIGDEVMARFDAPDDASRAAIAIQRQCHAATKDSQGQGLTIRIGMDFGNILLDEDDVFGDTVNDAAYVAQIARPNQIVITQALVDGLASDLRPYCEEFDRVNIKGEQCKSLIFRMVWEPPAQESHPTTVMEINHITEKMSTLLLTLSFNHQEFIITENNVPFVIGRDHRSVDLHIDSSLASRDHCHILLHRGKFVLADHSTNGSYIKSPEQQEIYLRREELPLMGEGTISIGRRALQAPELTITYKLSQ